MLGGVTETSVSDLDLEQIIKYSTERVNADISKRVVLEKLTYLDNYRQNQINSSNTTFYVNNSWRFYLGDYNNDGKFSISDIEVWDYDPNAMTRTQVTPASLDIRGAFTLSYAPITGHEIRTCYRYCPLTIYPTVDPLIQDATAYLSASLSFTKISPMDAGDVQIGRMKYATGRGNLVQGGPAFKLMNKYYELVKRIDYMYTERIAPGIRYYSMDIDNAIVYNDQDDQSYIQSSYGNTYGGTWNI